MPDNSFIKPFAAFAPAIAEPTKLRRAITAACRRPEEECLPPLIKAAGFDKADKQAIAATARRLVEALRRPQARPSMVEELVQEYALSSEEGIALMCLAEALLRIPDNATRDALIRDKLANGDWKAHLNSGRSMFVNAATWGLILTGRLAGKADSGRLGGKLTKLLGRYGEPLIRKAVAMAINLMGEQFVRGETIEKALQAARGMEEKGFRYSYDMLGEAAMTAADARRYFDSYTQAIHAIGAAAGGKGIYEGPGISIKLSALHPRYSRAQADRVMSELLPRVRELALLARRYNIGFNIDAEEADRLEISLDIIEALLFDEELQGWDGIGFVVQAYGRRCPYVLDYLIDAARRSKHRLMLRLVKGAYWDSEIKRTQIEGLSSYPVYTRKIFTDIAYIACARKLLDAPDAVFPQFATHNAQTLATIYHMAGADYTPDKYEFQCLHGMGEALYSNVVGADRLGRPARIYAPVGHYETLLAYLVRRLLENGANSSFVHRIADKNVTVEDLIADPAESAAVLPDLRQNDKIARPQDLFLPERQPKAAANSPQRRNSAGLDLSDEMVLSALTAEFQQTLDRDYSAVPSILRGRRVMPGEIAALDKRLIQENAAAKQVVNPADRRDIVGYVLEADAEIVQKSFAEVRKGALFWHEEPAANRADILAKAADLMQARGAELLALCCREAGKSIANAVAELREAIDFLRYYGAEVRQ
ncbi:MAG: bifunctional proline dehydrogenase/L-glutamate gamma-semialdehyde dehydrogenase PutA, partial [Candidatus Tokpelaia sp.]